MATLTRTIHNTKGVGYFLDYVSYVPEFMRSEGDIVELLQVFSDYLNNAYRNTTTVDTFSFKFVATDSTLGEMERKADSLRRLFASAEEYSVPVILLSKPQGNRYYPDEPVIREKIVYGGRLENLTPSVITSGKKKNGDLFYIEFTESGEEGNTGTYIYDEEGNTLTKSAFSSSQDPFTGTPNTYFYFDNNGYVPRMLKFMVSDVSSIGVRRGYTDGNAIYYEVFLESVSSAQSVSISGDEDSKSLIDYYDTIDVPDNRRYSSKYSIEFIDGCVDFEWDGDTEGGSIFYFKDLEGKNVEYISNKSAYSDPADGVIETIPAKCSHDHGIMTFNTSVPHNFCVGERFYIDGRTMEYVVSRVLSETEFCCEWNDTDIINEAEILSVHLFYTRKGISKNGNNLYVPYALVAGDDEVSVGDQIIRISLTNPDRGIGINLSDDIDISSGSISVSVDSVESAKKRISDSGLSVGNYVYFKGSDPLPSPLEYGEIYRIADISAVSDVDGSNARVSIRLNGVAISATGNGAVELVRVDKYVVSSKTGTGTLELNDVSGLKSGMKVSMEAADESAYVPNGYGDGNIFIIDSVNPEENSITLRNVTFSDDASGIVAIHIYKDEMWGRGVISEVDVESPMKTGHIGMEKFYGDLLSEGLAYDITGGQTITIGYGAGIKHWDDSIRNVYAGELYAVKDGGTDSSYSIYSVVNGSIGKPLDPLSDIDVFQKTNSDLIVPKYVSETNPYMFGMYRLKSLEYGETIDYANDIKDHISDNLYIQKEKQVGLIYDTKDREFVTNPRFADVNDTSRHGYIEIYPGNTEFDIVNRTAKGVADVFAGSKMITNGVDLSVKMSIDRISCDDGHVTLRTVEVHNLSDGMFVDISCENEDASGVHAITVVDPRTFSYDIAEENEFNYSVGTVEYRNVARSSIHSISVSSGLVTVKTGSYNGLSVGDEIGFSGIPELEGGLYEIVESHKDENVLVVNAPDGVTSVTQEDVSYVEYSPKKGDFVMMVDSDNENGGTVYIVGDGEWEVYDLDRVQNSFVLYSQRNLFDINDVNSEIADGTNYTIKNVYMYSDTIACAELYDSKNGLMPGEKIYIEDCIIDGFNGKFEVLSYPAPENGAVYFKVPAFEDTEKGVQRSGILKRMGWYKYIVEGVDWQAVSKYCSEYYGNHVKSAVYEDGFIRVITDKPHGFSVGDGVIVIGDSPMSGEHVVEKVDSDTMFRVNGTVRDPYRPGLRCAKGHVIQENSCRDNVSELAAAYEFKKSDGTIVQFKENDVVMLMDQCVSEENGLWKVSRYGEWERMEKKFVAKITSITAITDETEAFYEDDYEVVSRNKYRVFDYETVLKEIDDKADGLPCYICDYENVGNHSFRYRKMDHIDTMASYHEYYDTKYDLNSVVPDEERAGFIGISDHGYPILERIERIAYLKDPDAIDFDVISYLAKYMGYDITCIWDDIRESPYYTTKDQQERATRRFIQTLPHYHMLKSTESGVKALMLLFGVAADVVKLWTENENPYDEFIREYDVKTRLEADAENGNVTDYIPTPYFDVRVDIGGGQDIQFLHGDKQRVVQAIKAYKPINTVFRDIFPYLEVVAKYRVYPTMMDTRGRMTADIGFEDDFDLDSLCDE